MEENQRINVDIEKALWRQVSIRCAEEGMTKREFMEQALQEKLVHSSTMRCETSTEQV